MGCEVAVIGAGNVGCALAADLALRGIDVRLQSRDPERLEQIALAGGLTITGAVEGRAAIPTLTTDIEEAVTGAAIVAVAMPTPALPELAPSLLAALLPNQMLWLDPGHSGGALYLGGHLRSRTAAERPLLCQTSTASHGCRLAAPTTVNVFALPALSIAAFPADDTDTCVARLAPLLRNEVSRASSVLALDLENINAVMHPVQMVCNASRIEATAGDFHIYDEGTSPATAGVIEAIDRERLALAQHLGITSHPLVDLLAEGGFTTRDAASTGHVYRALQAGDTIRNVNAPPTLDHRYLHEDVGWGLVQWIELARAVGVDTTTMSSVATLAGTLNHVDYSTSGLTLERMHLHDIDPSRIATYALHSGG